LVNYTQIQEFQLFSEGLTDSFELSKKLTQVTMSFNFKL